MEKLENKDTTDMVITGDHSLHHKDWNKKKDYNSREAKEVAEWIMDHSMELCTPRCVPTH